MAVKVAINGLGRIGRIVLRCCLERKFKDVEIVALNDLIPPKDMAYYVKFDSTHGKAPFEVKADEESLILDGQRIPMFAERDPAALPWKKLGVDIVMECTGRFTKKPDAMKHVEAGAKHVIISAPADGVDRTIVLGVNEKDEKPSRPGGPHSRAPTTPGSPEASTSVNPLSLASTIAPVRKLKVIVSPAGQARLT